MSVLHVLHPPKQKPSPQLPTRDDIEAALERVLSQLAALDCRYDHERSVIEQALHPRPWKDWRLAQVEKRHQQEREPLVQLVGLLHQQLVWSEVGVRAGVNLN